MPAGAEAQVLATELERVETKVPVLFERDDTFFSQIEKRPAEVVSSVSMRIPLELRPGGKPGHFSSDGGDMGRGEMPLYDKATISTVELIYRMEWTTRRKWATDTNRKSVINAFRRDLASGMKEFRRFNDSLCMTAGNGVLATVTGPVAGGGTTTATLTTDGFGARLLRYGQDIDVWDSGLLNKRTTTTAVPITFYDGPNKTIKFTDPDVPVQAGDKIVAQGITATPPVSILGVPYHASSASVGDWLGFNRANVPEIRANSVSAGGALALSMPRLAMNKIGDRIGNEGRRLTAWMHPCQKQGYEELGQELIRIDKAPREEGLDLYFNDNMRIAGMPLKTSYSWDKTRIDMIDLDAWGRAEFHPVGFYKDENGNRFFVVRGTSGGVATSNLSYIVACWNLYINNPAAASYIDTLTVPSGY